MLHFAYILLNVFILNSINTINTADLSYAEAATSYYSPDDEVIFLDGEILESLFYEVSNAWVVHLHRTGCKHCINFASLWKKLAIEFAPANDMIKFGEFECSAQHNNINLCSDMNTTKDLMMVRYFHENFHYSAKDGGQCIPIDLNLNKMKKNIINQIMIEKRAGRGKLYPNLAPYLGSNVTNLIKEMPNVTSYVILIFETPLMTLGEELALDFHFFTNVSVKHAFTNSELVKRFKIAAFPTTLIIARNQTVIKITNAKNKAVLKKIIDDFFNPKPKMITLKPIVGHKVEVFKETNKYTPFKLISNRDYAYLMDLETAVRYSFKREIGILDKIEDKKYDILMKYIDLLLKYFPFTEKGHKFFIEMKQIIQNPLIAITGKKILHIFNSVDEHYNDIYIHGEEWFACHRKTSEYHRYLCGFWKLFHFFTVSAAKSLNKKRLFISDHMEILRTLRGYIKYFMKNQNYTRNTLEIIDGEFIENVDSYDGAILWLWTVHNVLNNRFSEEGNHDPEYPKIQFPSKTDCEQCRSVDNTWNVDEILKYMKRIYSNFTEIEADTNAANTFSRRISEINFVTILDHILHILLYLVTSCLILTLVHMVFTKNIIRIYSP